MECLRQVSREVVRSTSSQLGQRDPLLQAAAKDHILRDLLGLLGLRGLLDQMVVQVVQDQKDHMACAAVMVAVHVVTTHHAVAVVVVGHAVAIHHAVGVLTVDLKVDPLHHMLDVQTSLAHNLHLRMQHRDHKQRVVVLSNLATCHGHLEV